MTAAFDLLKSTGIAVVVAAGNDGFTDGIEYPACISGAVSVAAVDDSDNVASFSDVGPNASLFAPGVNVNLGRSRFLWTLDKQEVTGVRDEHDDGTPRRGAARAMECAAQDRGCAAGRAR
jgi:subtilisin family serine protease